METEPQRYQLFRQQMEAAGYDVEEYEGRNHYKGPAVITDAHKLQDAIRATSVRVQTDDMGKSDIVVYPA